MALPTTGYDAHGNKMALEPVTVSVPPVELTYVQTYHGFSYNSYLVQYLGKFWPTAEAVATIIYGSTGWGAHWSTNPAADGTRVLTVHTD